MIQGELRSGTCAWLRRSIRLRPSRGRLQPLAGLRLFQCFRKAVQAFLDRFQLVFAELAEFADWIAMFHKVVHKAANSLPASFTGKNQSQASQSKQGSR